MLIGDDRHMIFRIIMNNVNIINIKIFLPNTSILFLILAALRLDLAEGSGAVIVQVESSRISVESSLSESPYPPVTRSTCKIMIMYLL